MSTGGSQYGTWSNPVSLHVQWEKKPGSALHRLYGISKQLDSVDLVNGLWRQAWPQALWTDMLCDGMLDHVNSRELPPYINIEIQVSSDELCSCPETAGLTGLYVSMKLIG